ncbi:MAG: hypothetical protein Q8K45_10370 [Rubrivivax sp.]|nr:hypothetical protein [Rubrivivax sp.]
MRERPDRGACRRVALQRLAAAWAAGVTTPLAPAAAGASRWAWRSQFTAGLADWPGRGPAWGADNQRFLADPAVDGRLLRVALQRGGIDPGSMRRRGLPPSGTGFKARLLAGGSDTATLRYRLRFADGFDFVRGGKLPGLFGGDGPSGGRMPDGRDGFSLRLMWREGGQGEVYAYLPTSRGQGSALLHGRFGFVPGRWHELVQAVHLNTPGRDDGRLQLWLDGRQVGSVHGLRFRDSAALRVDGVFFDVFFGGNDDSWAARADTHVDFADFALATDAGGPR